MGITGKIIGAIFGYLLLSPLGLGLFGLIVGVWLGNRFDQGVARFRNLFYGATGHSEAQKAFFDITFSVMGHIAKSDGRVSEQDIRFARQIMAQLQLTPDLEQRVMESFQIGKHPDFNVDRALDDLMQRCRGQLMLLRFFFEIQMQAAFVEGMPTGKKLKVLQHISRRLGFGDVQFSQGFDGFGGFGGGGYQGGYQQSGGPRAAGPSSPNMLNSAYSLLEITSSATDDEVKKAYRRQMNRNHPDKLVAKGLPEEMIKLANQKTQKIKEAYELIKRSRGK